MEAQPESEITLAQAVSNLTAVVKELNDKVKKFPTREEVTREGRIRAFKVLVFGIVLILIAQLLTIVTISSCFLGTADTDHARWCSVMPGYDVTVADGQERLARFNLLLTQIETNRSQIAMNDTKIRELDIRIQILEKELKAASP